MGFLCFSPKIHSYFTWAVLLLSLSHLPQTSSVSNLPPTIYSEISELQKPTSLSIDTETQENRSHVLPASRDILISQSIYFDHLCAALAVEKTSKQTGMSLPITVCGYLPSRRFSSTFSEFQKRTLATTCVLSASFQKSILQTAWQPVPDLLLFHLPSPRVPANSSFSRQFKT